MQQKFTRLLYIFKKRLHRHRSFVFMAFILLFLTLSAVRFYMLSNTPVDTAYIEEQKTKIQPIQFNDQAIKKIEALRDSNVKDPGTNLSADRQNPFVE